MSQSEQRKKSLTNKPKTEIKENSGRGSCRGRCFGDRFGTGCSSCPAEESGGTGAAKTRSGAGGTGEKASGGKGGAGKSEERGRAACGAAFSEGEAFAKAPAEYTGALCKKCGDQLYIGGRRTA